MSTATEAGEGEGELPLVLRVQTTGLNLPQLISTCNLCLPGQAVHIYQRVYLVGLERKKGRIKDDGLQREEQGTMTDNSDRLRRGSSSSISSPSFFFFFFFFYFYFFCFPSRGKARNEYAIIGRRWHLCFSG